MGVSITSANAVFTCIVRSSSGVVVGPFTFEGFAEDAMFAVEPVDTTETKAGADGLLSGGRLPWHPKFSFSLMANSPTVLFLDNWVAAQEALGDVLVADGFVSAPSLGKAFALTKGFLTRWTPIPAARKTFSEPQVGEIHFEKSIPAPVTV